MAYVAKVDNYITEKFYDIENKLYDLKHLREIVGGSPEILVSLADIYLTTMPFSSWQLVQATKAEDWLTVSKLAHKIKPTIDSMNIVSISSDIRTLEASAKNQVNTHTLGKIAIRVDHVINTVAHQLKYEFDL